MLESAANAIAFRFGDFELIPAERFFRKNGENVRLPPRALEALILLVESQGKIVTKEDLIQRLWPESFVEENNLSQAISTLRKVLGTLEDGKSFIETVPKTGYRFAADIEAITADAPDERPAESAVEAAARTPAPVKRLFSWKAAFIALFVVLLLTAAILGVRYRSPNGPTGPEPAPGTPKRLTFTPENDHAAGWTTDGKILFTRWLEPDKPETFVISPEGGTASKATDLPDVRQAVWSPDGSRMVFWKYSDAGAGCYLSLSDGSNVRKLPFNAENISWAPDGRRFAFQTDNYAEKRLSSTEIVVYSIDDEKISELTSNTNFDGDPGWAPDGSSIVFSSDRDGNYEIYAMKADGINVRRLTNNTGHDSFPKYSPDGTLISFNSNFENETTDIYLMRIDGSSVIRITDSKNHDFSRSGWSPDGTKFAYNVNTDGNDEIFVMDLDPFRPTKLISSADAELQTPAYSPDGRKIVYSTDHPERSSELCIFNKDSGKSAVILQLSSAKAYPRWSPDGKWIAFHQEVNGRWDIFKVRPDGTDLTQLTTDPASDSIATWSADSQTIYFRSNRFGDNDVAQVFKMNADGSGQSVLPIRKGKLGWPAIVSTRSEIVLAAQWDPDHAAKYDIYAADILTGTERLIASREKFDVQPTVSADGRFVAFTAESDGNFEIYLVNADGTMPLRLTRNPAKDNFPSLSPDGSSILFASERDGKSAIYELALN